MKIVVGHKVLNLEELTTVATFDGGHSQVIVDSQLYAELGKTAPTQQGERKPFTGPKDSEEKEIVLSKS